MRSPRQDPASAPRRPTGTRAPTRAPGQVGLAVLAICAVLAAVVALSGDGQTYWLCIPAGLLAASWCRGARATALASAATMVAAGAPTLAWSDQRPAAWAAVVVPIAAAAIAGAAGARLERECDDLRDFALTDPLTRVANRRALLAHADHETARHRRAQSQYAIVMLDLDGFKSVNDRFGHGAGDDLLRDVARSLQRTMRAQDMVARLGGDEFCVLAPDTDREGARRLAGRVAAAVRDAAAGTPSVRASVGAAVFPDDGSDPEQLIAIADTRLLGAKRELYRDRPAQRAA